MNSAGDIHDNQADNHADRLDAATSARLGRLAGRPVDLSDLHRRMQTMLEQATADDHQPIDRPMRLPMRLPVRLGRWWRPVVGAAAAVLIALSIGWLALDGGASPAMAASAELARIHQQVIRGQGPYLKVSSIEQANQLLADQASGIVPLPALPGAMKGCCLRQHAGTTLTCALLDRDGQLITVAIADGAQLHSPHGRTVQRGNRSFILHEADGINMVMLHARGRWLCVMGDATTDTLLDVAAAIDM